MPDSPETPTMTAQQIMELTTLIEKADGGLAGFMLTYVRGHETSDTIAYHGAPVTISNLPPEAVESLISFVAESFQIGDVELRTIHRPH